MTVMEKRVLAGGLQDMSNIIRYERNIIDNILFELKEASSNLNKYSHEEIKMLIDDSYLMLRDNRQ